MLISCISITLGLIFMNFGGLGEPVSTHLEATNHSDHVKIYKIGYYCNLSWNQVTCEFSKVV